MGGTTLGRRFFLGCMGLTVQVVLCIHSAKKLALEPRRNSEITSFLTYTIFFIAIDWITNSYKPDLKFG